MKKEGYRRDLDGLRALAVLAVIFYHAELKIGDHYFLSGGFLGVDVFFVLSGFLITWILMEKEIKIFKFFKSRFDRIYPALLLVIFLSCLLSYFVLMPRDLASLADSAKSALFFYSNYFFMAEDSYVADSAKFKALLHTWSLSLEWQFYLAYPFIILFIKRYLKAKFLFIIFLLFSSSFFYCIFLMKINLDEAFYSSPSRFWELFFGGFSYALMINLSDNAKNKNLAYLGFFILIISFFCFDDSMNHPGFISLLVVLSTASVIIFNKNESWLFKVFSYKYISYLGLISYSLYLLHQPIFVFFRFEYGEINWSSLSLLLVLILAVSALQYGFYEKPMRSFGSYKKYFLTLFMLIFVVVFINAALNTEGFPRRLTKNIASKINETSIPEYRKLKSDIAGKNFFGDYQELCINRIPKDACSFGMGEGYVTLGDSFVGVFDYYFANSFSDKYVQILSYEQCPLLDSPIWLANTPECWEINKKRWVVIEALPPSKILLGTNFQLFNQAKRSLDIYFPGIANENVTLNENEVYASFKSAVERLRKLGHHPIILGQPPQPSVDVYKEAQRMIRKGIDFEKSYGAISENKINNKLKDLFDDGYDFVDLDEVLCDDGVGCLNFDENGGIYNRGNHFSDIGVSKVMEYMKRKKFF